jgi:hypothetical protein
MMQRNHLTKNNFNTHQTVWKITKIKLWRQSKNSDQTRSSDQPDQTCNHRTLRNTDPILFKLGSNLADEMFISKNLKENFKIF